MLRPEKVGIYTATSLSGGKQVKGHGGVPHISARGGNLVQAARQRQRHYMYNCNAGSRTRFFIVRRFDWLTVNSNSSREREASRANNSTQ